ncbi:MAG: NADP-reducing hydrogenase subunit HndC [Deltaproteobacteria bacterium ADurb.Bin510]|nr:MAG: NADP-reducing hydrogenase subunit HndC [Deltaproteobacteria bacterium ADurb.Bin510]
MKYLSNTSLNYDPSLCRGCGRCVEVCPHGVFELTEEFARITDRERCMECGACSLNCAWGAIRVRSGVGCAAALINAGRNGGQPCC